MGVIRDLDSKEIERLLSTSPVGRIACCGQGADGDGGPYVVPLAYGYDGHAIYAHSGIGKKIRLMRAEPRVTFEVDSVQASDRWRSVIAVGRFEEIEEPSSRSEALSIIYRGKPSIPWLSPETIVFRIVLTSKTSRYELPK